MPRKPKLASILGLALLTTLVLLTACGDPTATTAPQTTAPAATTAAATTVAQTTAAATTAAATSATTGQQTTAASANTTSAAAVTTVAATAACTKLNLNTLTEQQVMTAIPNFSNRMVREFLEYRPYSSILQFRKEIGKYVDASQVTEWEKYVFVPVDRNNSDAETLKQLPGVDATIATALTTGRPYASNAVFLQALGTKVSAQQLASASCYLVA